MKPDNGYLTKGDLETVLKAALVNVATKEDVKALEYDISQLKEDVLLIKGDISSLKASYQTLSRSRDHLYNRIEEVARG